MSAALNRGCTVLAIALATAAAPAMARDAQAGRVKSQACMVCHGEVGISTAPDAPNLAGQPALYVAAQLKAYRVGDRRHEVMGVIARMLSDADIENLAEWYASIRIEAQAPE
jgi:cytochrome c553